MTELTAALHTPIFAWARRRVEARGDLVADAAERRLDLGFVHQSRSRACQHARRECAELQYLEPLEGPTKQVRPDPAAPRGSSLPTR